MSYIPWGWQKVGQVLATHTCKNPFRSDDNFKRSYSLCYLIESSTISLKGYTLELLNKGNEEN